MDSLLPLQSDVRDAGFQPYVLDLEGLGLASGTDVACLALVVRMREGGCLLAIPEGAVADEDLQLGEAANAEDLLGPHLNCQLKAALMSEENLLMDPTEAADSVMDFVLVDFNSQVATFLNPVASLADLDGVLVFDPVISALVPSPPALVAQAVAWAMEPSMSLQRIQYYSADEFVPETPVALEAEPKATPRSSRRRAPDGGIPEGGTPQQRKKPTVASLAESMESLTSTLPQIMAQLQDLAARTSAIEGSAARPDRVSALRRPLFASAMDGSTKPLAHRDLLQEMPQPKSLSSAAPKNFAKRPGFSQGETEEIQLDMPPQEQPALAQAVLEQSKALTALVSQMASGEHLGDFPSSSSSLSSKGSVGRAKLQAELAQHKGVFFQAVIQNMSRRMFPAQSSEVELSVLKNRGATPTQYLERFGGYGRTKDIGFIQWQVGLCLNLMLEENWEGARDSLALLFVCLEQTSMDNGRMDIGLLLALAEDPPQSLFSGRSLAASVNPRPFAPTASQRWATIALQYLKEMDVIATRRKEVTGKDPPAKDPPNPTSKPTPKRKGGKGAAKAKASNADPEEE